MNVAQMTAVERAKTSETLVRIMNNLTDWDMHARNPAKYPEPKTKIAAIAKRLQNLAPATPADWSDLRELAARLVLAAAAEEYEANGPEVPLAQRIGENWESLADEFQAEAEEHYESARAAGYDPYAKTLTPAKPEQT
jgi:hypothetical protein